MPKIDLDYTEEIKNTIKNSPPQPTPLKLQLIKEANERIEEDRKRYRKAYQKAKDCMAN